MPHTRPHVAVDGQLLRWTPQKLPTLPPAAEATPSPGLGSAPSSTATGRRAWPRPPPRRPLVGVGIFYFETAGDARIGIFGPNADASISFCFVSFLRLATTRYLAKVSRNIGTPFAAIDSISVHFLVNDSIWTHRIITVRLMDYAFFKFISTVLVFSFGDNSITSTRTFLVKCWRQLHFRPFPIFISLKILAIVPSHGTSRWSWNICFKRPLVPPVITLRKSEAESMSSSHFHIRWQYWIQLEWIKRLCECHNLIPTGRRFLGWSMLKSHRRCWFQSIVPRDFFFSF